MGGSRGIREGWEGAGNAGVPFGVLKIKRTQSLELQLTESGRHVDNLVLRYIELL